MKASDIKNVVFGFEDYIWEHIPTHFLLAIQVTVWGTDFLSWSTAKGIFPSHLET